MAVKKNSTILLVEDDPTLIEIYKMKFTEDGYQVTVATSGVEGLAVAVREVPQIILLDIILPEMDGFAVLEALKKEPKTKDIPVLLLSNLGQDSDIAKGKKLGAADYLVKANFTPSQLADKIKSILK